MISRHDTIVFGRETGLAESLYATQWHQFGFSSFVRPVFALWRCGEGLKNKS